ncbi:zinc-binding alcohol dehydrogenase family protein [Thermodesulfobium narugense DSM 14796]|uniref:Zinc-binding alcohol dehydrogenase family protein n=1 Tax=Thermodesulfobium narugense DSM 14796 TaxID=747365 RepID=M1E7J4_9BACT|nr:zinc-dependent alcohol dehydrogenase family protein [Thermodesulfobium narugense]AEE14495.1 zinc-binding alcohol dehydrogenase family protein [Thermodesulfobium narugense DSM 14796]
MKALVLDKISKVEDRPLKIMEVEVQSPGESEILVEISCCGICHTELDEIEGRVIPKLPIILGHQIVGRVKEIGKKVTKFRLGDRVGIAWINSACGKCYFCKRGEENLCNDFKATGCDVDGGYAQYCLISENFCYKIPDNFSDVQAAPLLCAGAVGYRSLKLTNMNDYECIGLFGFGASAHIVIQIIRKLYPNSKVFVFTRRKDDTASKMAQDMGADWVGATGDKPPKRLNRAIDTTPAGYVIREALSILEKGGRLVTNLIRKESLIPELNYQEHLWNEKELKSVANITRDDVKEFLDIASSIPIVSKVNEFDFEDANKALVMLKHGEYKGAGVLIVK